jgi:beta-lactamase regulating signal transducer with metallopeptidase domain
MSSWLIETLVASTLLMLLVLALRRPVARLWGPHLAYALWALPLLRMLLPPLPGWEPLLVPVAGARPDGHYAVALMPASDAALYTQPLPAPEPGLIADWPALLLILWAAGAVVWLAVQWARHLHFVGNAVRDGTPLTRVCGVDVILSAHVPGPMAAGVWRRRILLPGDFLARYTPAERRMTLLHEGAHHDRGDLIANLAGLVVLAAHWWNPVAHVAWRAFRADQELACDATVLAGSDGDTRAAYGRAVLKSACVATPLAACAMNHKSQLKERIGMMKDRKFGALRRTIGGLLVAGVATAALAATASGQSAPPQPPAPPTPAELPVPPSAAELPQPPAPPAAPQGKRVMVIKQEGAGLDGAAAGSDDLARLEDDLADAVHETKSADGRHIVMVRRHALAGEHAAAAGKAAQAAMADVKSELRAECTRQGITMAADADVGQLAMCGRDVQAEVRLALAKARKAITESRGMSDAQRTAALKGLDAAKSELRREMIVKIER